MIFRLVFGIAAALVMLVADGARAGEPVTVSIGVTAGPHAQIFEVVKPIAARSGLILKIVEFSDYNIPNAALAAGDLQANSFQHQPYLDHQVNDRGYDLVSVAPTVARSMVAIRLSSARPRAPLSRAMESQTKAWAGSAAVPLPSR